MGSDQTLPEPQPSDKPLRWRQKAGLGIGALAFLGLLAAPAPDGLGPAGWHAAAVATLMAVWWISEAIPIPATALLPLILFPTLGVADIDAAARAYAHPLVFLFMGGFLIALAMQRWNLHRRIALMLIRRVGAGPAHVVGGFMLASAFLSMWVSNTATTLMMMPVALSVTELARRRPGTSAGGTRAEANFATALMLGIAYAASIGGMSTLVGTPPNAFMAGFMSESYGLAIGFAEWMAVGLPLAVLLLPVAWLVLVRFLYPFAGLAVADRQGVVARELAAMGPLSRGEKTVLAVFSLTAGLWICRPLLDRALPGVGLNDTSIAMFGAVILFLIPVRLATGTFALDWSWARRLPWGVLILFGGGLSLADAIRASGLAEWIGAATGGLGGLPALGVVVVVVTVIILLTELTSNTATTATFLPVVASVAIGLGENPLLLVVPAALAASCAFMMPVATPPNAIVFASGHITMPQMVRAGIWMNLIGIAAITAFGYTVVAAAFGIETGVVPDWARP